MARSMPYEDQAADDGQRECSRGQWCAGRRVTIVDGEQVSTPALGPRAFCAHDWDLIGSCLSDMPGIYGRLQAELAHPAVTETSVHVPAGPSVPMRMDVEAAMRLTAWLLRSWQARVITTARLDRCNGPVHTLKSVHKASGTLEKQLPVLLALQPGWMTHNVPLPSGRMSAAPRGIRATCARCGRSISYSAASGKWWGAYRGNMLAPPDPYVVDCEHEPLGATVVRPAAALIPPDIEDEMGDAEIVRFGEGFAGLFIQRDGAAAGLEILHLHYWCRAVLRETPARPEDLLGVECRSCSLPSPALRRAEPAWHRGDPEYYSECAGCGHLMTEDEYRTWVGQLHAYHKARLAAMPTLAATPAP